MAKVIRRTWTTRNALGKRIRHTAYGYTLMVNGIRERKSSSEWVTEADALAAVAERQQQIAAGRTPPADRTLGELAVRYVKYKTDQGKRTVTEDARILERQLVPAFGAGLLVRKLTAAAIAAYEAERIGQVSAYTVANELAILRHALRLAWKWGDLETVPEIGLPKKPGGAPALPRGGRDRPAPGRLPVVAEPVPVPGRGDRHRHGDAQG